MMSEATYYDGTKLLSMVDLDGEKPSIYVVTTNRTGGKTTYFSRLCVRRFLNNGEKFGLIYRYNYELNDVADKFYKDIQSLFFNGTEMKAEKRAGGMFCELFIDDKSCGYALSLNNADGLKKYSHFFSDIQRLMFDEFQSETNHYCADEIRKFRSLYVSVARGQGKQTRYVPVYMCSNPVSILNPYYVAWGISSRLNDHTKFLKSNGLVLEQGYVKSASDALKSSGFNKAFQDDPYTAYAAEAVYLNDNKAFVDRPQGVSRYLITLKYKGNDFAIREFADDGVIYCDDKADKTFPHKITVTTDDHDINYVMLKRNDMFLLNLRYFFEKGCFRFKDLKCKEAVLNALSY